MKEKQQRMLHIVRESLWKMTDTPFFVDEALKEELNQQAILPLTASVLQRMKGEEKLIKSWRLHIYQNVFRYERYLETEKRVLSLFSWPCVVLKGTSAAQYYPYPSYRTFGDIDIMVQREDYLRSCDQLLNAGFIEVTTEAERIRGRHRGFKQNGIEVEIHFFFASMSDPQKAEFFDQQILKNISADHHRLPDLQNGLVILEHISQHMWDGLGLRQIIDWMMFVDYCLDDAHWQQFRVLAAKIDLERLALIMTRMCQQYLGLRKNIRWCNGKSRLSCALLLDYVLQNGNFGNKAHTYGKVKQVKGKIKRHVLLHCLGIKRHRNGLVSYDGEKYVVMR